jgi:UDP-glucose 4-epimerase
VLEVIETVRKVSGNNFEARLVPRRPGGPAGIVAASDKIRANLGWQPQLDDLTLIVTHALNWERRLTKALAA